MPRAGPSPPVQVLLVEDSPNDAELMTEALDEGPLEMRLCWVQDGEEALAFLRREGKYSTAPRPDLVLLDLRLPCMDGNAVLEEIRQDTDPDLRRIPVVLMTGAAEVYNPNANCCVAKPADQEAYARAVQKIAYFWLTVARRPRPS
jgi:CheY-like chemotaxis protein